MVITTIIGIVVLVVSAGLLTHWEKKHKINDFGHDKLTLKRTHDTETKKNQKKSKFNNHERYTFN